MKIEWSDKMRSRGRTPRLFLVRDGVAHEFSGKPIPRVVAVLSDRYDAGKWSNTTYSLFVADDTAAVELCCPFEGWGSTWTAVLEGATVLAGACDRATLVELVRHAAGQHGSLASAVNAADENAAILEELEHATH